MNILFLTMYHICDLNNHGIYEDLLREFVKHKHNIYVISPVERRYNSDTVLHINDNIQILELRTGNLQKTNLIEKGISTLMVEPLFISAIKKYFSTVKFDLILYSTPPITLAGVVNYVKKRDTAKTYLLLKDIFPQNAIDVGFMSTSGIKGLIYKYFRKKEKFLYSLSDRIGCMSQANVDYVLTHNSELPKEKVEICPNCIEVNPVSLSQQERIDMRDRYGIPQDKKVFVYGGNLGRPQDVAFIIECLRKCEIFSDSYFVIAGSGTDRFLLERYVQEESPSHVKLMGHLPKNDYDKMVACCDVGMIFLDHRFTIPNFPSRLLSYMQAALPVLACTDSHTDIGRIIVDGGFGWACESNSSESFTEMIKNISKEKILEYKDRSLKYLNEEYSVQNLYSKCFLGLSDRNDCEKF